ARFHRQMPAVMARDADNPVWQSRAGLGITGILLADMHAVAAQLGGEVGAVIEDEGGAMRLHQRAQHIRGAADLVVAGLLEAQLEGGDVAARQRAFQHTGEILRRDARRRNQIKAATTQAAFFSSALLHLPVAARLFIAARWAKAACALATFSGLPAQ